MRRCRFATSRLITREAATSEHCVEFPRHTGKERKCSLSFHHQSYPPSLLNSNPQPKQSLGGYAVSNPRGFWGGKRRHDCRGKDAERRTDRPRMTPHLLTLFVLHDAGCAALLRNECNDVKENTCTYSSASVCHPLMSFTTLWAERTWFSYKTPRADHLWRVGVSEKTDTKQVRF